MNKKISHAEFKKELLRDSKIAADYEDLEEEYQLIRQMLRMRKEKGLTQEAVAEAMHTSTSAISRLESMHMSERPSPSFSTLKKYAHALKCRLNIELIPIERHR